MSFSRNRQSYAADSSQRVAMNDRNIFFTPKRRDQIKRHQITAHRYQLLFALFGHPQYRHKCAESLHFVAAGYERIFNRFLLEPWAINYGIDSPLTQSFEQALD